MARDREIPAPGVMNAPFELVFERNAAYCSFGLGGEREFQVEERLGSKAWKV